MEDEDGAAALGDEEAAIRGGRGGGWGVVAGGGQARTGGDPGSAAGGEGWLHAVANRHTHTRARHVMAADNIASPSRLGYAGPPDGAVAVGVVQRRTARRMPQM